MEELIMPGVELSLSGGNLVLSFPPDGAQSPLQVGLTDDAFTITSPANHTLTISVPGGQVVFPGAQPFPLDQQGLSVEFPEGGTITVPHRLFIVKGGRP